MKLPHAATVRKSARLHDLHGRGYLTIPAADVPHLGLPQGYQWYYCVLPLPRYRRPGFGDVPQLGQAVGRYHVHKLGPGYVRGRAVGAVALR